MSFDLEREEREYRKYKADNAVDSEISVDKVDETSSLNKSSCTDFSETPYRPVQRVFSWSSALIGIFAYLFHRNQIARKKWHKNGITFFVIIGLLNVGFSFIAQSTDTMTHLIERDAGWVILNVFLAFFICRKIKSTGIRITLTILVLLVIQCVVSFIRTKLGFEAFEEGTCLYWISLILNFVIVGFVGQNLFNKMQNSDLIGTQKLDALWKSREKKAVITGVIAWSFVFIFYVGVGYGEASVSSSESIEDVENYSNNKQMYLVEFGVVCDDALGIVAPDSLDDVDQVLYLHNQIISKCGVSQIKGKKIFDYYHFSEFTAQFPQVAPSVKKYGTILYTYETKNGELAYIFAYKNEGFIEKNDTLVLNFENENIENYDFETLCSDKPGLFVNMVKQGKIVDCAKYLAAEIGPFLAVYTKLQEAYFSESGRLGNWNEIGMQPLTDLFFEFVEFPDGVKIVVPKDIRQCLAGNIWLYQAKKVNDEIKFDILEPTNEACKNILDVGRFGIK